MRRQLERALHSKVALRMAILFIACAVVPLVGLALMTLVSTTDQLEKQAWSRLHYDVKTSAMEALERLSLVEATLRVTGAAMAGAPSNATVSSVDGLDQTLGAVVTSLAYFPDRGPDRNIRGTLTRPVLTEAQARHFGATGRIVVADPSAPERSQAMLVRVDAPGGGGVVGAALNHRALFELDNDELPPWAEACVVPTPIPAACSAGMPGDVLREVPDGRSEQIKVDGAAGRFFMATWAIPLKASYGAEPWTAVMMRPESAVLGAMRRFARDFWLVLGMSVLFVMLVAISQVRRQLQPVASLAQGTRRLAARDFDSPVQVRSGDEFEELGASFNALAQDLKRQFAELEAFNLGTLSALARAIDAKSSWTAGHSERVTKLAVALAAEMGLPAEEIEDLRRGGLIHDIGKLATPGGILDKAGPLTDAEVQVMRQHTQRGVHILEPIPGYERLLPLVGQHHERWDGSGYPGGLKGETIARTARVLAVADVCDALQSDRPYRSGMAWTDILSFVRERSGSQFDPAVVAALLRLDAAQFSGAGARPAPAPRRAPAHQS